MKKVVYLGSLLEEWSNPIPKDTKTEEVKILICKNKVHSKYLDDDEFPPPPPVFQTYAAQLSGKDEEDDLPPPPPPAKSGNYCSILKPRPFSTPSPYQALQAPNSNWPSRYCVRHPRWHLQCVTGHCYYHRSVSFFSPSFAFDLIRGEDICKKKYFYLKSWFSDVFSSFYGQRSVTAAWATRSPGSIWYATLSSPQYLHHAK